MKPLHRWDLTSIYPSIESKELKAALKKYGGQIDEMDAFLTKTGKTTAKSPSKKIGKLLGEAVTRFNEIFTLAGTIGPFLHAHVAVDSRDQAATRLLSEYEQYSVKSSVLSTKLHNWIAILGPTVLKKAVPADPSAASHAFFLFESLEQARFLMSEAEELLAAELTLSGGRAFGKLQGTLTSQLTVDFELDGQVKKMPIPALINLRSHPDEATRRRGYETENIVWEKAKETLAFCLNGVKGETLILDKKRGRIDNLHASLDSARMDRKSLGAMLEAMRDSFPVFRKYLKHKAKKLGKEQLAWWDLSAPLGKSDKVYSLEEARDFIVENFGRFSPELGDFAKRAFDQGWIDAEPREGKRAGAFCMGVERIHESRILANFEGSFNEVSTLAHELGHAFHNECAYQAGKTPLQQSTPMTLAETASIMCERIIVEAALRASPRPEDALVLLEAQLNNATMVIVDIYSRYLFEKEVFERRIKSELTADDFCQIMERAQKETYGEGLDPRFLQKFMWTWKPHYYTSGYSFYNYPYAFGLLFATGLYGIYEKRGEAFVPDYKHLLASTGENRAAELADRFGLNIRTKPFWSKGLAVIGQNVERFCAL